VRGPGSKSSMPKDRLINAMTVDVEDYFQVSAFEDHVPRHQWDRIPARVEENTERILGIFEAHDIQATFFVLGWIAERFPRLVKRIHDADHEVASHGYEHIRANTQNPEEFRRDVSRTKKILEDTCGVEVKGFRAASFSIFEKNLWALDTLADEGYCYSSSIYPIRHDLYGIPNASRFSFRYKDTGILEVPMSTIRVGSMNLPCGGGGYFRLLPYKYFKWAINRINREDGKPAVFYCHPWEVDPEQPRIDGLNFKTRIRHYTNLHRTAEKLGMLLRDFSWSRMDRVFADITTIPCE